MAHAIVLGSGTSNGVPSLGFEYPESFLANPKNHRTRASLLLEGEAGRVLVDCAPEMRLQLIREKVSRVDAVILTHTHADHVMGMDDLRSICLRTGLPMPIYTLPEYFADVERIFPYAFGEPPPGILVPRFDLHAVGERLDLCGFSIEIVPVRHGRWNVIGLRVGGLAYLTDVNEIPPASWERLRGLDTLILDAVRYRPHPNHFHYEKALEVAAALGAKRTFLTHLSHDYDHDAVERELPEGVFLAYDGLRIEI